MQKTILELFNTFLKIGLFSFGGGYAMMPVIEREVVVNHKWVTKEEIITIFAITGCLPGAIALNTAAFIGYRVKGIKGTVAAVCGNLLPSVVIVVLLSSIIASVKGSRLIEAAFLGIRPVVIGLILFAAYRTAQGLVSDGWAILMCLSAFSICIAVPALTIPVILAGGVAGILIQTAQRAIKNANKENPDDS